MQDQDSDLWLDQLFCETNTLSPLVCAESISAVDASGNWRITFGWDGMDAIDVDLEDYH